MKFDPLPRTAGTCSALVSGYRHVIASRIREPAAAIIAHLCSNQHHTVCDSACRCAARLRSEPSLVQRALGRLVKRLPWPRAVCPSSRHVRGVCDRVLHVRAFERERELHEDGALASMMPATSEIVANRDGGLAYGGYTFPPCIVLECGESLEAWAQREVERDFVTTLQVRPRSGARARARVMLRACTAGERGGTATTVPTQSLRPMLDHG
jgi:hypothetical protein